MEEVNAPWFLHMLFGISRVFITRESEAIRRIATRPRICNEKFVSSRESVQPRIASNETTTRRGSAIKCRKAQKDSDFIKSKPSNNQTNVQDLMGICSLISLCDKKQVGCQGGISELVFDGLDSRKAIGPDRRISPIGADCCLFARLA